MKIIAESAFNHNGSLQYLKELALAAKNAGTDFFTVQVMNVNNFCTDSYSKYEIYKTTEFTKDEWYEIFDYCNSINLQVIPCVLEETSLQWCIDYGYTLIKIHATDITNKPLLLKISENDSVKIILETQCATIFEIKYALNILGNEKIEALFTGYSNYPSEVEELNLNVLDTFKRDFSFKTGFADHSLDTSEIPLIALAKGCSYLEKHITLSRNNRNYDWQVSLYPHEFAVMVNIIKHYSLALGDGVKHPTVNEKPYRNIMYKKVVNNSLALKRANDGEYFLDNEINSFSTSSVVVALIARLKSQRLKQKVLLPFCEHELIIDLFSRISKSDKYKVFIATSTLPEDNPLVELFEHKDLPLYRGDAVSVIDRMLDLAYQQKAGAIFRVTGDNPFTDPTLMEKMLLLLQDNNLDYVKTNNIPFGVGAELFSTSYLWRLYKKLETTKFSEYLTWYVLKDEEVRMGCIDVETAFPIQLVNLSVDLKEDYERCKILLSNINKKSFSTITLADILKNIDKLDVVDTSKEIKLPGGITVSLMDYLDEFDKKQYIKREKII